MELNKQTTIKLACEQRTAILLHVNERLYEKGEISKTLYEYAKVKILAIK